MSAKTYNLFEPKRYGNVTVLHRIDRGKTIWTCKLDATEVLRYCPAQLEVRLDSGEYRTATTKRAMNTGLSQVQRNLTAVGINAYPVDVFQFGTRWFVRINRRRSKFFFDGMYIHLVTGNIRTARPARRRL